MAQRDRPERERGPGAEGPLRFAFECPLTWESLAPTEDAAVRHCGSCNKTVTSIH